MRQALAVIVLGVALATPGPATAGGFVLGWQGGVGFQAAAPVVVYPSPYVSPYYPPGPVGVPYVVDGSYFRPLAPYAWNPSRNWRDTWQDDGVKVHGYTWR